MAGDSKKAKVTLGGVALVAHTGVTWRFQTGVAPYQTVMTAYKKDWDDRLESQRGQALELVIEDARGASMTIKQVWILHQLPSSGPNVVSFVVSDLRWRWPYRLVSRDYNIPKKTGNRTALQSVPVEQQVTVDEYQYRAYSLNDKKRWTSKDAIEDILKELDKADDIPGSPGSGAGGGYKIDSFPIDSGSEEDGQFTIQNVMLRDQGDVALARMLGYVPGAEVWIDPDGKATVIDGTDLDATERYVKDLPPVTWDGETSVTVERRYIRPKDVFVYYQREIEMLLEYSDDYTGGTSADPPQNAPYLENVLPTTDPETTLSEYDPEINQITPRENVPPGTWVEVGKWLVSMNEIRPTGSLPWTFETIALHWQTGNLDAVLGGTGIYMEHDGSIEEERNRDNVAMRIQALKTHFRQTFRLSRRYTERLRDLQPVRAALLDPVTGARAPASVWGQACIVPSKKGLLVSSHKDAEKVGYFRNIDMLKPSREQNKNIIETAAGPTRVIILDQDLGIMRIEWIASPYGTVESITPCNLVNNGNQPAVPQRNLAVQDDQPVGVGMRIEEGTNEIKLSPRLTFKVLLTVVPCAPNNLDQFYQRRVTSGDVADIFRNEFRIQGGVGPQMHIFVPPGELTARFAWKDDKEARQTLETVMGIVDQPTPENSQTGGSGGAGGNADSSDEENGGLKGFVLTNADPEIKQHSQAVAAEALVPFADAVQGRVAGVMPDKGLKIVGNMSGAMVHVAAAPSAKVSVLHEFPGQQKLVSRMAMLPESARHLILGTIKVGV